MHTQQIGAFRFHYNSDLSGSVIVANSVGETAIPCSVLLELVSGWVAAAQIAALENADPATLFGLRSEQLPSQDNTD